MILNMVKSEKEALSIFAKIEKGSDANIEKDLQLVLTGKIENDQKVASSIKQRDLFMRLYPNSQATKDITIIAKNVADKVERDMLVVPNESGLSGLFKRLIGHF